MGPPPALKSGRMRSPCPWRRIGSLNCRRNDSDIEEAPSRNLSITARIETSMKAIQVKQPGGPEAMELVDLPVPEPKANEAVGKLAASGVNFIDADFREGRYKSPLPFVL